MTYLSYREKTISDFDKHYEKELSELERDINKTMQLYEILLIKNPIVTLKNKFEYIILILRSVDYLISATSLLRQRAIFETGAIMRLSIETSSTAFHIFNKKKEFINYKQNKYKSTRGITYANKKIKGLGELWGALSKVMAHTNTYHGISTRLEGKHIIEEANLVIGTKQLNEQQDKMMLNLLRIAANISFRFFELIVSKHAKYNKADVLYIEDYDMIMVSQATEEIIYELMEELKKIET